MRKNLKHMLRFFYLAVFLSWATASFAADYQVSRIVDGDTIVVTQGSVKLTIRLVGIDAPEVSHKKYEPGQPSVSSQPSTSQGWS